MVEAEVTDDDAKVNAVVWAMEMNVMEKTQCSAYRTRGESRGVSAFLITSSHIRQLPIAIQVMISWA